MLKNKSEVGQTFRRYVALVKTQFGCTIKTLRTDNELEHLDTAIQNFMIENGIYHQTSCTYTPQQNGVAEQKNRHLLEVTRAIMFAINIPKQY